MVFPAPKTRRLWLGPAVALFACGWGGNQFTPLVGLYVRDLGLSESAASTFFLVYVLGLVPGFLLGGLFSDRIGRRVIGVAVALTAVASLLVATGVVWLPAVFIGRFLVGFGLGCAMSTGATWVRELSEPPFEREVGDPQRASRRSSLWLTAGFGLGPLVAGVIGQWSASPLVVPYLVQIPVAAVALWLVSRSPETVSTPSDVVGGSIFRDRVRFVRTVVPIAPAVFGAMAVAFIVVPTALEREVGENLVLLSTALTICALMSGFVTQIVVRRHVHRGTVPLVRFAFVVLVGGITLAAVTVAGGLWWLAPLDAVVLGCSYGVLMVAGLAETQALAAPGRVGVATAVFYSLAYTGFFLPTIVSLLTPLLAPGWTLAAIAVLAACVGASVRVVPTPVVDAFRVASPASEG